MPGNGIVDRVDAWSVASTDCGGLIRRQSGSEVTEDAAMSKVSRHVLIPRGNAFVFLAAGAS